MLKFRALHIQVYYPRQLSLSVRGNELRLPIKDSVVVSTVFRRLITLQIVKTVDVSRSGSPFISSNVKWIHRSIGKRFLQRTVTNLLFLTINIFIIFKNAVTKDMLVQDLAECGASNGWIRCESLEGSSIQVCWARPLSNDTKDTPCDRRVLVRDEAVVGICYSSKISIMTTPPSYCE